MLKKEIKHNKLNYGRHPIQFVDQAEESVKLDKKKFRVKHPDRLA